MIHRIGFDEAIELYESKDLNYLSKLATDIREAKNGKKVFYNRNAKKYFTTEISTSSLVIYAFTGVNSALTAETMLRNRARGRWKLMK